MVLQFCNLSAYNDLMHLLYDEANDVSSLVNEQKMKKRIEENDILNQIFSLFFFNNLLLGNK